MNKLLIVLFLAMAINAHAGRESNGGMGVTEGPNIYLLDFYEFNVQKMGNKEPQVSPLFDSAFMLDFTKKMGIPLHLFNSKILDLVGVDHRFSESLLNSFKEITWEFVDTDLPKTYDDYTDLDRKVPEDIIIQLAVRQGKWVRLQKKYFNMMDSFNKTALLFHEAISHLYYNSLQTCPQVEPTSKNVRRIVTLTFSKASKMREIELEALFSKVLFKDCH